MASYGPLGDKVWTCKLELTDKIEQPFYTIINHYLGTLMEAYAIWATRSGPAS